MQTHIAKFLRSRIVHGCGSCFIGSMSLERSSSRRRVVILICFVLFIATILLVLIGAYLGKKVKTVEIAEKEVGYPDWKIYRFQENTFLYTHLRMILNTYISFTTET